MSDSIEELAKGYKKDVHVEDYPRSIGLFTIPEYPELEGTRGMWSAALDAILTTLRYLAPATILTLFWGQQSFLFTLLRHIDNAFRAIVFSSEEQKQAVIKWLGEAGPVRVERLDTVWRHGWVLCSVLDKSLPGACAGHPPTRLSLKHAQAIADHYLGVEPVFSRQELETNDSLSRHQEWKLATYLERVREALSKITPPVSKPPSQRTSPETAQFTMDYVARGSGLTAAQVNHKMSFKIYPTAQQSLDPGEITVLIKGPKDTYGMTVLPNILGKAQKIRQKLLGLQSKQIFTENALPITQGAAYLRAYGKNDMNKTYFIPKTVYDIEIESAKRDDHTKILYTVQIEGKYEVSITSRGQHIVGSPFMVTASHNIIHILEKENFCLEDGEEIDIVDVKTSRKVVLRIVDFVTEKMLLRENGALEKITEDEAKSLMMTDLQNERPCFVSEVDGHIRTNKETQIKPVKFRKVAQKVLKMNRVCKVFKDVNNKNRKENDFECTRTQDIPDVVNSTLINDGNINQYLITEKRDKYIVPENISVSIKTEKSKTLYDEDIVPTVTNVNKKRTVVDDPTNLISPCSPDSLEKISEEQIEADSDPLDRSSPINNNNPFFVEPSEDFTVEKKLGTFLKTEFERNNLQNEEMRECSITIELEKNEPISSLTNPFYEIDVRNLERPKTPVYKIITGNVSNRIDSPYLDQKNELISEEMLGNEFVNPFFVHQFQTSQHYHQPPMTDFIIGAPVSLPPMIRVPSPEPKLRSLMESKNSKDYFDEKQPNNNMSQTTFKTDTTLSKPVKEQIAVSSTFHSFDSSFTDTIDISNSSTTSDNQCAPYKIENFESNRQFSPRKDIWDSAYVSIDDNNSSPDNNNNENSTPPASNNKRLSDDDQDISNMGPAERELWQTCAELNDTQKVQEEIKPYRWEIKRPIFTPIIEESDRSISSSMKETSLKLESDPVTVAFAELNDVYEQYFPNSENSSTTDVDIMTNEGNTLHNVELKNFNTDNTGVESASETLSDVTRHEKVPEGTISEVQTNVTESVSASQVLQDNCNDQSQPFISKQNKHKKEMKFGDKTSNIVLEKKKYWDEKIRQIEANTEETTRHHKRRRTSAKQLKHDSLSKRKGKQIVKNFLNASDEKQKQLIKQISVNKAQPECLAQESISEKYKNSSNEKMVERWKKYWNEKLEIEHEEIENELRSKSPRSSSRSPQGPKDNLNSYSCDVNNKMKLKLSIPVKQELPEEVFKAFETSPKRFFGTSRKHIMNKIDTFIGKPSTTVNSSPTESAEIYRESGLVSSRISLFHNISNSEPLPWMQRKSQSMQNIHQRKDNEKNVTIMADKSLKNESHTAIVKESTSLSKESNLADTSEKELIKNKWTRIAQDSFNKSFDETDFVRDESYHLHKRPVTETAIQEFKKTTHIDKYKKDSVLRKTSISKSEMDIFNKIPTESDDNFDKHKSCDELPKINVKNFISLYESVSKTSEKLEPVRRIHRPKSVDLHAHWQPISVNIDSETKLDPPCSNRIEKRNTGTTPLSHGKRLNNSEVLRSKSVSIESIEVKTDEESIASVDPKCKETTYISLSDIELEIVESSPDKSSESSPDRTEQPHIDYKNRFKKAKQFFQSLEELREDKKQRKLNECEMLLLNQSSESLENDKPQKRLKKKKKSHSMPSSELAKYWNQMQSQNEEPKEATKLVKISEKFHVEDLFSDVMEGRLSRQGSLRGIPHKKAVLEAFRSMENICDEKMSSYEMATSKLSDFSNDSRGRSAQSYLNEYPYLPTTDPSKYHSRLDAKASGLITLKELLDKKERRNSVPDLRLNAKFSEDL